MTIETRTQLAGWVERYVSAWTNNDPATIGSLLNEDATYRCEPYAETWIGRDNIVNHWLANEDQLGSFDFAWRPVVVTDDVTLVEGLATYADSAFSILWVIKGFSDTTCSDFTEWWMELPSNVSPSSVRQNLTTSARSATLTTSRPQAEILPWLTPWVSQYVSAWKHNDPDTILDLFAEDGILQTEPYVEGIRGRRRVLQSWLANPEKLGDFDLDWRLLVATDEFAVVEGTVAFATETYNILWPLKFDDRKRCLHFLEWWMRQPAG